MTRFHEATLWGLAGPAAGTWYALVLPDQPGDPGTIPEVLIVPATSSSEAVQTTKGDVVCPAESSPTGERLVFAPWATAPIPSHCLSEPVGLISSALAAIIDLKRIALAPSAGVAPHPVHARPSEPEWHRELRRSLVGYWDGSVMISCATIRPVGLVDPSPVGG